MRRKLMLIWLQKRWGPGQACNDKNDTAEVLDVTDMSIHWMIWVAKSSLSMLSSGRRLVWIIFNNKHQMIETATIVSSSVV